MKAFLRSDGVQAFLGWVLGTYLRLILRTVRWRHENLAAVEPVLADDARGAIALFWHGRIPLCLATLLNERPAQEYLGLCAFGGGFTAGAAILQMR